MANYFVVLPKGPSQSSDAEVGRKPTNTSEILAAATVARFVKIEAASVPDAQEAARCCYAGASTTPIVVTEAQWKES